MLGWAPQLSFSESLAATTSWYKRWFRKVAVLVASIASSSELIDAGMVAAAAL
jgi:dTDP-D-glucose 4,6-dehydratase